jgi:hypothetical protein
MVDATFEPFQTAILDFYRRAPEGSRPHVIHAGVQDLSMYKGWRREHPEPPSWPPRPDDGTLRYHGLEVELAGRAARVSVAGETSDGEPFEYPPS